MGVRSIFALETLTFQGFRRLTAPERALVVVSLLCGTLYLITRGLSPRPGAVVIKGLCMSALALLSFRLLKDRDGRILCLSLLCSSAGDVFLALDFEHTFVLGLVSFLIAHLLYILLFLRHRRRTPSLGTTQTVLIALLVLYSAAMGFWLFPGLGNLSAPVMFYLSTITAMVITAILADFHDAWVVTGGLLFVFSDSLIAATKFRLPIAYSDYLIWAAYYAGQYCIAAGFLNERLARE